MRTGNFRTDALMIEAADGGDLGKLRGELLDGPCVVVFLIFCSFIVV